MQEIVDLVREKGLRHLLVCDSDKKLLGVISDRDLCSKRTGTARDLMSARLSTTTPETPINQAITCMIQERISCLPVVENDRLCGLITTTDLMLALAMHAADLGIFHGAVRRKIFPAIWKSSKRRWPIKAARSTLRSRCLHRLQNDNPLPEIVPLFEQLHQVIEKAARNLGEDRPLSQPLPRQRQNGAEADGYVAPIANPDNPGARASRPQKAAKMAALLFGSAGASPSRISKPGLHFQCTRKEI